MGATLSSRSSVHNRTRGKRNERFRIPGFAPLCGTAPGPDMPSPPRRFANISYNNRFSTLTQKFLTSAKSKHPLRACLITSVTDWADVQPISSGASAMQYETNHIGGISRTGISDMAPHAATFAYRHHVVTCGPICYCFFLFITVRIKQACVLVTEGTALLPYPSNPIVKKLMSNAEDLELSS